MKAPRNPIMHIPTHTFCWHGLSTEADAATPFYASVLGWTITADGDGGPVCSGPGGAVAHIQPVGDGPAHWCSYLAVEDVDASTARVQQAGGTVLVPPTDLPVGRFSVVTTPTGAAFGLYQPDASDALAEPGPGSVHWVELHSPTPEADRDWLGAMFGFEARTQPMGSGPYHVLLADGEARGGVMASKIGHASFLAWVEVDDLDAALAKVQPHGGATVEAPFSDPAVGRMAVVSDPAGAVFGLVQPTA